MAKKVQSEIVADEPKTLGQLTDARNALVLRRAEVRAEIQMTVKALADEQKKLAREVYDYALALQEDAKSFSVDLNEV